MTDIQWMSDAVDASLGQARLRTWLLGLFGAMALPWPQQEYSA